MVYPQKELDFKDHLYRLINSLDTMTIIGAHWIALFYEYIDEINITF